MNYNLANLLTLTRIAFVPVMVVVFYLPIELNHLLSAAIFGLAALTDWLDGYVARHFNQTSKFGAFLDPVADKFMVAVALLLLVTDAPEPVWAFVIPTAVIIGREIAVSALREWMANMGRQSLVAVSMAGKVKTTTQMIAIFLLLLRNPIGPIPVYWIGYMGLYIAALMTLWSMICYLMAAWPELTRQDQP
ncbi:MAG: CDP-diacylglycerol--glycerol-3-phosphate 3-phosphatidyltransferase [Gammaproteobacteria bacterium]|nr:MAG: CDP-diacylglycerol--glycerol-3-phosphate 3-phosphatidyltransferase [Gammaproteobacteria bacterium]